MNDVADPESKSGPADRIPRHELVAVSVCSITILMLTAFELWPIGWLEAWGFITGGICVWLTVRENVWTWPVGIANKIVSSFLKNRFSSNNLWIHTVSGF